MELSAQLLLVAIVFADQGHLKPTKDITDSTIRCIFSMVI